MYLSKIWLFLLGVAAAAALAVAIIVPWPATRTIAEVEKSRLELAQVTAQSVLRVHTRKWIDKALEGSVDGLLRETLEKATGTADASLEQLHNLAAQHLDRFHSGLKNDDLQIAIDGNGRVIARHGVDAGEWKDSLVGHPLIADALRGYARDDVWIIGDKLYVVGASPVPSDEKTGKLVGAYVVGDALTTDVANQLKKGLGADIAFFANRTYASASVDRPLVDDLPKSIDAQKDKLAANGRSDVLPLSRAGKDYLAILAPLPGIAGAQESYYALILERPTGRGLMATLKSVNTDDRKKIPWIMLIALFVVAIGGGIALQVLEHDRPIRKLQDDMGRLSKGEISKLDDTAHRGKYGSIARSVNMALERSEKDAARSSKKSLGDVLGPPPSSGVGASIPPSRSSGIPMPPPPTSAGSIPSLPASSGFALELPGAPVASLPPQPRPQAAPAAPAARPSKPPGPPPMDLPPIPGAGAKRPAATPPPPAMPADEPFAPLELPPVDAADESGPTRLAVSGAASEDTYHRQVFEEFLGLKKKCGEATDGLTYEKFSVKLRANRDQLVDKYGAKSVKFQVYVKDGKAALKATPLK